jgi:hypothetical protein
MNGQIMTDQMRARHEAFEQFAMLNGYHFDSEELNKSHKSQMLRQAFREMMHNDVNVAAIFNEWVLGGYASLELALIDMVKTLHDKNKMLENELLKQLQENPKPITVEIPK